MRLPKHASSFTLFITTILIALSFSANISFAQLDIDQPIAQMSIETKIHQIEWNADGSTLAVVSDDGLYMFDEQLQILTHEYPATTIDSFSWSPDGDFLAITHDQNIEIWGWDGTTLSLVETLTGNQTQLIVSWSPDGTYLATVEGLAGEGDWAATIHFWDTTIWQVISTSPTIYSIFYDVSLAEQVLWNPTGSLEFVFLGDTLEIINGEYFVESVRHINFIDPLSGNITRSTSYQGDFNATASAWRPQGDVIAVGFEPDFAMYDATTDDIYPSSFIGYGFNFNIAYQPNALDWTTDGRYLAANEFIYGYIEGKYVGGFTYPEDAYTTAVDWHPDNFRLARADSSGRIKIEDATLFTHFEVSPTEPVGD